MPLPREITDQTVLEKTGKKSNEWYELLDKWGAQYQTHTKIAKHLYELYELSPWWAQIVTNRYEWSRGLWKS